MCTSSASQLCIYGDRFDSAVKSNAAETSKAAETFGTQSCRERMQDVPPGVFARLRSSRAVLERTRGGATG